MTPYSKQDITRAILHMKHQRIVHQTALEGEWNATRKGNAHGCNKRLCVRPVRLGDVVE